MHMVGIGNIHIVGLGLLQHPVIVGVNESIGCMLHAQVYGMFHTVFPGIDACHLYLSGKLLAQHL